jgi:ring-1,2-phenylacetyl-CoA epoxidase subunit PaaD
VSSPSSAEQRIPLVPVEELARLQRRRESPHPELWQLLDQIVDPELPVVTIWELGILQDISVDNGEVLVTVTPTYSGCPAMTMIAEDIGLALERGGHNQYRVLTRLSPAWTTAWMSASAREKLHSYGVAPPDEGVVCPQCNSSNTQLISEFGSTACKALYRCLDCAEPFDHFKLI